MTELEWLESQPNWVATFESTSPAVLHRYRCLMKTVVGTYYWHIPDHRGIPAGATKPADLRWLAEDLREGRLRLVRGALPPEIDRKGG